MMVEIILIFLKTSVDRMPENDSLSGSVIKETFTIELLVKSIN